MKHADMKISVIIPCHNAELYLAQTIGSVLDQNHCPNEIIIVDDGSTDRSLEIARRFQLAAGDLVQVYSESFRNAARTRNLGASLANGDALMFLDADDLLAPDALESLAAGLADRPGGIAACPWRRLELENGEWISRPASCARRRPDQDALSAWLVGWYYTTCSVLWSKKAFVHTGGWDEETFLNDDGDLMMRALLSDIPLIETASGTSYYRRLPEGQTSLSGKRYTYGGLIGRMAVIEKVARMLEEQKRIDIYKPSVSHAFALIAADAAGRFDGLCQQARTRMRQYAPSLWSRALASRARSRVSSNGMKPVAAPPRDRVEVIRFGTNRAETVLASALANSEPDAASLCPLPNLPAVSVIIPVYNRAHLLPRTLDGVLKQTFTDFEVLIVDDCSQDDPASVVAGFQDPRLRYLRQPENRGVAAARNRGLRDARAPLVAFLDDDDEWFPEKLDMQVDLFRRSPREVALIYTGLETVRCEGSHTLQEPTARGDLYRELLVRNILHGAGSNAMIRRNVVAEVGFFDENLPAIEDYDYWLRVSRHYKIDCISTPLVRYNDSRDLSGSSGDEVRRSLNVKANQEARNQFYTKHGAQMRKAGLAHLFLIDSARRLLAPGRNDVNAARRLALRAFALAPTSWEVRNMLLQAFTSDKMRIFLAKGQRVFERIVRMGARNTAPRRE
ncbi:glycosyltransferase [Haliea sp. E1-2-M8]|uniref:glycosyltransferase family 2 protein n=1 Tax=Haliea sp. E1-2-M8 TaxID=3064706 RepID=UPI00271BE8C4|nr:glycosyltransferase [Haliea sp. E1-2-M8]MDO8860414.1 glycosyltransferase [Haliea sp. E1-2-M8]